MQSTPKPASRKATRECLELDCMSNELVFHIAETFDLSLRRFAFYDCHFSLVCLFLPTRDFDSLALAMLPVFARLFHWNAHKKLNECRNQSKSGIDEESRCRLELIAVIIDIETLINEREEQQFFN